MASIALARSVHLLAYVEVLRRIGSPVERELRRARLPTLLDEMPDSYVSAHAALGFLDSIARSEGLTELGLLATAQGTVRRLSPDLRESLRSAPTLRARLLHLGRLVALENTNLRLSITSEGAVSRLSLNMDGVRDIPGVEYSEWLQIATMIDTIQDAVGNAWSPSEITFRARFSPPRGLHERFPGTRVRCGRADTSIVVPTALLSEFRAQGETGNPPDEGGLAARIPSDVVRPDFPRALKLALRPYLGDGYPDVNLAAQIAGTSARTLQRRLMRVGLSYRTLVRETRVEAAAQILAGTDARTLDAAIAVGYTDPSNFARAYRQVVGVNPRRVGREPLGSG